MRIGINVPFRDRNKKLLDAGGVAERAAMVEAAGLDGIWLGDHLTAVRPDPLAYLLVAAQATTTVELGTAIYIVPLRERYDLAQRFVTLQTLAPGRFTFGVGTGSSEREYELTGKVFEDRFRLLRDDMEVIRAVCEGRPNGLPAPPREGPLWGEEAGRPRFVLGAWHSEPQLRRAARDYDGWMASAGGLTRVGGRKTMAEAIKRYRDLGGTRALIATVNIDLRAPTTKPGENDPFFLECGPKEATERLHYAEELGYDDVIVHKTDRSHPIAGMGYMHDFTAEELEEIRSLIPKDTRAAVTAG
ncbi:MAG: LLM class flavin-dependent oxidoreductase [Acidimicrobiaceae bacterium]|nr:LLM class flavin-dependent oxidoreductase [Acidimicrobiaceae bacterium]MBO0747884.1 LLM class flavin-dependent oxidoreductase [Acidimicrobiaceae bacterium]